VEARVVESFRKA
jgi:hypothetical protein